MINKDAPWLTPGAWADEVGDLEMAAGLQRTDPADFEASNVLKYLMSSNMAESTGAKLLVNLSTIRTHAC
eukprot:SAG11_NODE_69_length_18453_cov_37.601613_14_plen_70_part_00